MEHTQNFHAGIAWSHYRQIRSAYFLAAAVAFLMSSYFVVGYLAGTLNIFVWDAAQWLNGLAGIGITGVMTAYQFFLYSSGDITGGKKATILAVCVAVGFSLLSEVGQGMERDHIRMEVKSQESPTYKALVQQLGKAPSSIAHNPLQYRLSQAEMLLARCKANVEKGIWKDCLESEARLKSLQRQTAQFYEQQKAQQLALTDKAKEMEKDESNYHPLVNLVRSVFGFGGAFASFLVSLILISFFEYAFHYLGGRLAYARNVLLSAGYDVTHRARKAPALLQVEVNRTDTEKKPLSDLTSKPQNLPPQDLTSNPQSPINVELEQQYQQWKGEVQNRAFTPTIPPSKKWLKSQGIGGSDNERQELTLTWLKRLEQEGAIIENPNGGTGRAKYILKGGK